jgi:hypothetical protein
VEVDASGQLLMIKYQYEVYKPVAPVWTWLAILLLAVVTLGWAMITHMVVADGARRWDFGVLPDTPASSPYATTAPPQVRPVPPQLEVPPNRVDPAARIE